MDEKISVSGQMTHGMVWSVVKPFLSCSVANRNIHDFDVFDSVEREMSAQKHAICRQRLEGNYSPFAAGQNCGKERVKSNICPDVVHSISWRDLMRE